MQDERVTFQMPTASAAVACVDATSAADLLRPTNRLKSVRNPRHGHNRRISFQLKARRLLELLPPPPTPSAALNSLVVSSSAASLKVDDRVVQGTLEAQDDRHQKTHGEAEVSAAAADGPPAALEVECPVRTWHPHVYATPPKRPTPHLIADIMGWTSRTAGEPRANKRIHRKSVVRTISCRNNVVDISPCTSPVPVAATSTPCPFPPPTTTTIVNGLSSSSMLIPLSDDRHQSDESDEDRLQMDIEEEEGDVDQSDREEAVLVVQKLDVAEDKKRIQARLLDADEQRSEAIRDNNNGFLAPSKFPDFEDDEDDDIDDDDDDDEEEDVVEEDDESKNEPLDLCVDAKKRRRLDDDSTSASISEAIEATILQRKKLMALQRDQYQRRLTVARPTTTTNHRRPVSTSLTVGDRLDGPTDLSVNGRRRCPTSRRRHKAAGKPVKSNGVATGSATLVCAKKGVISPLIVTSIANLGDAIPDDPCKGKTVEMTSCALPSNPSAT